MNHPTRAQVLSALAVADALPTSANQFDYAAYDAEKYDRALDVLAALGWLPDPLDTEKVDTIGGFEEITVEVAPWAGQSRAGITIGSPKGHKPFTDSARTADPIPPSVAPIEKLGAATVTVRVGDAEVTIEGPSAELIAEAVRASLPETAGRPLTVVGASCDAEVIPFPTTRRGVSGRDVS